MTKAFRAFPLTVLLAVACVGQMGAPVDVGCIDDLGLECSFDEMRDALTSEGVTPPDMGDQDFMNYVNDVGGCFVTGIGHIGSDENGNGISDQPGAGRANQDSYGGNAMGMKDGDVRGQWQNTTHLGDVFHGQATFLYCWNDGGPGPDVPVAEPNRAIWGGPGQWNHEDGYLFIVSAADYKEGKEDADAGIRDAYAITIYYDTDGDGVATDADEIVYEETDCVFGNFQIHPPNQGHPEVEADLTQEMLRISATQELCPDANW
jgi:hypothetical protein